MSRLHKKFSTSKRYAVLRRFVFDRDGWRCQKCFLPGALELHHCRPLSDGGETWDALNCMTLCRDCHIRLTARGNRRQKTETEKRWTALVEALAGRGQSP